MYAIHMGWLYKIGTAQFKRYVQDRADGTDKPFDEYTSKSMGPVQDMTDLMPDEARRWLQRGIRNPNNPTSGSNT